MQQQIMIKNGNPKYIQIRDHILQDIRDGKLRTGSKLPSRDLLIDKYSVARATLNMAINDLTKSGVLNAVRRKGTFVANADSRIETALVCDLSELGCDSQKTILRSNTSRNSFNYILTYAPKNLHLNVIDFKTLQDTGNIERYRKVLMLMPTKEMLGMVKKVSGTELCIINRSIPGSNCVTTDHRAATRDVTNVFLDKFGHDCQMFFLDMTRFSQIIRNERREGFVESCEAHQMFYRIVSGNGFGILDQLLDLKLDPNKKVVIISGSRYLTGAGFKFSIIKNLTFGKNLFYADFDNFDTDIIYGEPMISVVQDYNALGQAAIDFLTSPATEKKIQYIPHRIINQELYFSE
jgi:DNA-binding transcriptional regulator YhcF (GntR family)